MMKKKDDDEEEEMDFGDLLEAHYSETKNKTPKNETPLERYRRKGTKLPPPNNPHTKAGRAWIAANCKPVTLRTTLKRKKGT